MDDMEAQMALDYQPRGHWFNSRSFLLPYSDH